MNAGRDPRLCDGEHADSVCSGRAAAAREIPSRAAKRLSGRVCLVALQGDQAGLGDNAAHEANVSAAAMGISRYAPVF